MITPLCGNGMSMALHASKLAASRIDPFLKHRISRAEMERQYRLQWKKYFSHRLKTGRRVQRLFGRRWITNYFVALAGRFPKLIESLIRKTHGEPF
jgi:flavin-dependent dehydrogenase